MPDQITISKTLRIRECGLDEYWLQDQIANNPSVLGLGDLQLVRREKQQCSGGKLDLLLKEPETDAMYEVEIMLGGTDESHIIRTIEYWDLERKRWPQRQHSAVLVAEDITSRFFNVIQLFSQSIPLIAVRANIIEAGGIKSLHFAKILDTYQEPEEETSISGEARDENWWKSESPWTLENARLLMKAISTIYPEMGLNFTQSYVALTFGNYNHFALRSRSSNKSLLDFWINAADLDEVMAIFTEAGVSATPNRTWKDSKKIALLVDQKLLSTKAELFVKIAQYVRKCWQV